MCGSYALAACHILLNRGTSILLICLMSASSGSLLIPIISAYWWRAAPGELRPKPAARDQSGGNEEGLAVTSCIAHAAPEAADSGFLWLSVSCWERGTNRQRDRGRTEMAIAGLLSVCSSPNPLQVQPTTAEEIHQLCSVFIYHICSDKDEQNESGDILYRVELGSDIRFHLGLPESLLQAPHLSNLGVLLTLLFISFCLHAPKCNEMCSRECAPCSWSLYSDQRWFVKWKKHHSVAPPWLWMHHCFSRSTLPTEC